MTDNNKDNEARNPYTRPSFIAAAVVVAVLVVLATTVIAGGGLGRDEPDTTTPASPAGVPEELSVPSGDAVPPADPPPAAAGGDSVCGLAGGRLEGTLSAAPPVAQWRYAGTTAYPVHPEYGPGRDEGGVRSCFQRSPEGAVFFAANGMGQVSDAHAQAWMERVLSAGVPDRARLAAEAGRSAKNNTEVRSAIAGFRLLSYDGRAARVDLAIRSTGGGMTAALSVVFFLIWEDGDWKLGGADDPAKPIQIAQIPDLLGYLGWTA